MNFFIPLHTTFYSPSISLHSPFITYRSSLITYRGAGGIRTLVHTLNQYAFYMLSLSLIVGQYTGTNTQDIALASKISFWLRGLAKTSLKFLATRYQAGIRHLHLRAVSSPVTLTED